jgi:hypothetical protein
MTEQEIYDFLKQTGHLEYAHGVQQPVPTGPCMAAIRTAEGMKAIASFQEFMAEAMDRECLRYHGRPARFNGESGPATLAVMNMPRCGHPDYGPEVGKAIGYGGGWAGCHGIGDYHCANVAIDRGSMPSFLSPVFDDVWERVQFAYMDIGLKYQIADPPNTSISFVTRSNGWIGLAIVGQGESCSSQIWAKFLATYKPANVLNEWTTLIMHELGHNAGLDHSRGGVMNPSIVPGLPPTWRGDPSEPILVRAYGGVPIAPKDDGDEYWIEQGFRSNKGQVVWTKITPIKLEK